MTEIFNRKKYDQELFTLLNPVIEIYWHLLVSAGVPAEDIQVKVEAMRIYGTQGIRKARYLNETYANINLDTEINK